jgi:hypothetical protein
MMERTLNYRLLCSSLSRLRLPVSRLRHLRNLLPLHHPYAAVVAQLLPRIANSVARHFVRKPVAWAAFVRINFTLIVH